jgi:hypothetical protein
MATAKRQTAKTNSENVLELMEGSATGPLMGMFVVTAIQKYSALCLENKASDFGGATLWLSCASEATEWSNRVLGLVAGRSMAAGDSSSAPANGGRNRVTQCAGFTVTENQELNQLEIRFPSKPVLKLRNILKYHNFRFDEAQDKAWWRALNRQLVERLTKGDIRKELEEAIAALAK